MNEILKKVADRERQLIREIKEDRENLGIGLPDLLVKTDELARIWAWYRQCPVQHTEGIYPREVDG